jgi:phospholipase D1/2
MTTAGPSDGGSNPENLKEKIKHPFHELREKFRDSKLYDLKVGIVNKKQAPPPIC